MTQQENTKATPDERIVHQARVWRRRDQEAIANSCSRTKRAEYLARQQLREVVDMLEKKAGAG